MMKTKTYLLAGLCFSLFAANPKVQAQQLSQRQGFEQSLEQIKFDDRSHDFGEINELDGPVRHTFRFKNTNARPVRILSVKASCGCTTPAWTKEEVAPGEEGEIVAEYNPLNRPGSFNKSLTVTSTADATPLILTIKGSVKPKPRTPEDDFPTVMGNLRVKYRGFNMGKVTTEGPVTRTFEIYNQGDAPLEFLPKKTEAPDYIQLSFEPVVVPPKTRSSVVLTYDVPKRNDLGWVSDQVVFYTKEEGDAARKVFSVMATIEEYFPPMTQVELAKAPRLLLDRTSHEFGDVKEGQVVETTFKLTNTGMSELQIRKTKANCGCTVGKPGKSTLKPGESTEVQVRFDTSGRRGNQYKTVTIFSNDPTAPTQTLTLKGEVKQ
jgi:hypothetical protein